MQNIDIRAEVTRNQLGYQTLLTGVYPCEILE